MHRILFLPDTVSGRPDIRLIQKPETGYPGKAGYRISGRIFVVTNIFFVKYRTKLSFFLKAQTIIVFSKHKTKHDLVTKSIFVQILSCLIWRKNKEFIRPAIHYPDIRYPALPDIRLTNLGSGRIPDIKKGRIIRPDIRCIPRNHFGEQYLKKKNKICKVLGFSFDFYDIVN
jgi:hypothetical protein